MKVKILFLLLLSIILTGCTKHTSISYVPTDSSSAITNALVTDEAEATDASCPPQPTKVINEPIQDTYPEFDEVFSRLNSEAKDNELLRSYKVIDNQLYYIFAKDDITLMFPGDGKGEYNLKVGENEANYHWPITYYPGSKAWFSAELTDVTNDGIKDLCVQIYLGSGTGVCVSGLYVVDLSNMKDISFTDTDNYSLKAADAKKVNDMLLEEKKNYDYLEWITETPETNWSIMSFGLTTTGEVQLYLGLFKDNSPSETIGSICGSYIYRKGTFVLNKVKFEPDYISIYDGYEPDLKNVVDGYGNEIVTKSDFEQISFDEIKDILETAPFGEGNIIIFKGLEDKIYSGYERKDTYYRMDALDGFTEPTSISEYANILDQSGVVLTVGLGNGGSTTYYYYDNKTKRPIKLVALNASWEAVDLDADGSKELILRDGSGSYQYSFIMNTKKGIKYLDFSTYGLVYNKDQMYFVRTKDGAKYKFDGRKFLETK